VKSWAKTLGPRAVTRTAQRKRHFMRRGRWVEF
jgi:hypothetical protein